MGQIVLLPGRRMVSLQAREIVLSRCEFTLLRTLMSEPERVFTRQELCRLVWRRRYSQATKIVEVGISRLRRKMGGKFLIETVRASGYVLRLPS